MNDLLRKIDSSIPLRLGLGLMYLYSGYDIVMHPTGWKWAVTQLPDMIEAPIKMFGVIEFLRIQGATEILLGLIFLAWFLPRPFVRLAALISTVEMAAILLFVGIDTVTFRDIGLVGAGLALFLRPAPNA